MEGLGAQNFWVSAFFPETGVALGACGLHSLFATHGARKVSLRTLRRILLHPRFCGHRRPRHTRLGGRAKPCFLHLHRMKQKDIIIIAGPNGAGKTTFAREFLPQEADCPTFINADLIALGLSPFRPEAAAVRAGRIMLEMIADCVRRGESFAIETTLSGRGYARMIPVWQQKGYRVTIFFLELPSAELAVERVADRVAQGGPHPGGSDPQAFCRRESQFYDGLQTPRRRVEAL